MKKLIIQALKFFGISGIGWIIDFSIFVLLTKLHISEVFSNICSSFVAITFVYFVSTKKLFENKSKNLTIRKKFVMYIVYQIIVVSLFSALIGLLTIFIENNIEINFILIYKQIIAKIIVTPFTMILNFCFMKFLLERV